ncbi:glutamine ABC transporter permease [Clostridia bacterium]|nr:glutamine ABC transporter permease [Clostridia bacterium]
MKKLKKMSKSLCLMFGFFLSFAVLSGYVKNVSATSPSSSSALNLPLSGVSLKIGTSGLFGPFSYYDTDGRLIGYDIDLINALKEKLGFEIEGGIEAMSYSALTTSLAQGRLDLAAAALCATEERKQVVDFSEPYDDSGLTVMINKTANSGITGVNDLAGKVVAVESNTAAHIYATNNLEETSTIEVHETITSAYISLEQKKVDAVIQDAAGCSFYISSTPQTQCKLVGEEFDKNDVSYAIAFRKNFEYLPEFETALAELKADGTLDALHEKWCTLSAQKALQKSKATESNGGILKSLAPILLSGLSLTLLIAFFGIIIGFAIGSPAGYALQSKSKIGKSIANCYIWVIRGTPIAVQAIYIYYVLPVFVPFLRTSSTIAGILVVSINSGAFIAEIVRGALQSVDEGQKEAGATLGMTQLQILRHLVIPAAFRLATPALFNQFIIALKDTSLLSMISVAEMTQKARDYAGSSFKTVFTYTTLALFYLALISVLMVLQKFVERNMSNSAQIRSTSSK